MRIVESGFYPDAALSVYVKVKALGQRPGGCTAATRTLASYLGLSTSTVERGLARLRTEAPDGIVELPDSTRRSLPGGRGTTARRRVRPMQPTERFIWLPVTASEDLPPRLLRAYAVIAYAVAQKIPLTEGQLAGHLRHYYGGRAGRPITAEAAGRIVDALEEHRWITVDRRAGAQGRHRFALPDDEPAHGDGAPEGLSAPVRASTSSPDDGSGPRPGDGSLAYKEDRRIDRPDDESAPVAPAGGETTQAGARHHPPGTPRPAAGRDGRALRAEDSSSTRPPHRPRPAVPYRGPALTFSRIVHHTLEPVRWLMPRINTYVQRLIGREVGRQLRDGTVPERLRTRLTRRLARTLVEDIRDTGRWLLGVALPRWGCTDPDCEEGVLWSSGVRCRACEENVAGRRAGQEPHPAPRPAARTSARAFPGSRRAPAALSPVCCPECERPHRRGGSGICRDCRTGPVQEDTPAEPHHVVPDSAVFHLGPGRTPFAHHCRTSFIDRFTVPG